MADQNKEKEIVPEGVDDIDPSDEMQNNAVQPAPSSVDQGSDDGEEKRDVIDTIVPKAGAKEWRVKQISKEGTIVEEETYTQRPLGFFGKMQFFSLVGEVIDKSISGDEDSSGLKLSALFELPGQRGELKASDFREADVFVQGVGKLLTYAPDFLEKSYAIWLGVPDWKKDWAIGVMTSPVELGGLTDEEGLEIIEIFIDQNWETLEDFFQKKIASLRARVNARRNKEEEKALGA